VSRPVIAGHRILNDGPHLRQPRMLGSTDRSQKPRGLLEVRVRVRYVFAAGSSRADCRTANTRSCR
jgi:hypothetical protein